jgi:hypothetical protein
VFPIKYLVYFISGSILITLITIIAEKKSPKIAGILMCLPVITFLSLLFMAVSQGVDFSGKAALWNPIGAIADLIFMTLFAIGIKIPEYLENKRQKDMFIYKNHNNHKIREILFGLLTGFSGYFVAILILSNFPVSNGWISLFFLWVAAVIFFWIFRRLREIQIEKEKIISSSDIVLRGLFGGAVVAGVLILADSTGYIWGGLFSSFPGTITPVLVLLHLKNGREMSYSIIKSSPIGLSATGLYSCMIWLLYPLYGIIVGTLVSYLAVIGFLYVIKKTANL